MDSLKFWVLLGYFCFVNIDFIQVAARTSDKFFKVTSCSPADGIHCTAYFLRGLQNCSPPSLYGIFSDLYNLTDDGFPEKPRTFSVVPIEQLYSNQKVYPGANVTLQLPKTSSYKDVRAFEFTYYDITNTDDPRCVIFDLSNNSFTFDDRDYEFKTMIWPLQVGLYYFEGYSLPKPPPNEDQGMYLWASLKIPLGSYGYSQNVDSADWGTIISYSTKTDENTGLQSIAMQFAPPPERYGFTVFEIELWNENRLTKRINLTNKYDHQFNDLPSGLYTIKVAPYDLYFNSGNCLCNRNIQCLTCMQTTTGSINLTYVPPPTTTSTTTITTTTSTTVTSETSPVAPNGEVPQITTNPNDNSQQGQIVAAVLGSVAGVALVALMAFFVFRYRKRSPEEDTEEKPMPDRNQNFDKHHKVGIENPKFVDLSVANLHDCEDGTRIYNMIHQHDQPQECKNFLDKKRVFLAFAEDHQSHVDVVKCFANFLQMHCQCEVIFAPYCTKEIMEDKFRWILHSMDRSEFIIIVNSISAFHQYQAWKSRSSTSSNSLYNGSPLADVFVSMIQQVAVRLGKKNPDYSKYIMVRFDYTKEDFLINDICAGGQYTLMKHLQELLCHIHGINQQTTQMKDVELAFVEDYTQLLEGQILANKVKMATKYERENPGWYEQEHHDSGLDSAENFPEEQRDEIRQIYENNRHVHLDSISRVLSDNKVNNNKWNIPADIHNQELPSPCNFESPDYQSGGEFHPPSGDFHPPSMYENTDMQSEVLQNEFLRLNQRNMGEQDIVFQSGISSYPSYDEESECISLGGKSV